jgi:phosphoenolpyruvate synthase/pyruvate phosphate dikinase
MGTGSELIIPLAEAAGVAEARIGGKAYNLGRLIQAGYRVPAGFCIPVEAYAAFVRSADLEPTLRLELGRKLLSDMRWEEIWDAALRIRGAFLAAPVPDEVAEPILAACRELKAPSLVVRSSAPGEDSAERSYAGLHESLVGVSGEKAWLDAVRIVWASLWSDAALLYRRELELDVASSCMAVVVQELITTSVSGVGFGVDPLAPEEDRALVEAVPGLCEDLVAGAVDPDRWVLVRSTGEVLEWKPGRRGDDGPDDEATGDDPLLNRDDLRELHAVLRQVEELLEGPPDIEWTGRGSELTLLQARPVTRSEGDDEERTWYLSLRPGTTALRELCHRVSEELIPALAAEGQRLAAQKLDGMAGAELADALEARHEAHERWKTIYKDEFIPFAHGVRQLGPTSMTPCSRMMPTSSWGCWSINP